MPQTPENNLMLQKYHEFKEMFFMWALNWFCQLDFSPNTQKIVFYQVKGAKSMRIRLGLKSLLAKLDGT